jgi:ribosome-binding factor A
LGSRIGKQVRRIPELIFYLDDSIDYLENIDQLLNQDKEKES